MKLDNNGAIPQCCAHHFSTTPNVVVEWIFVVIGILEVRGFHAAPGCRIIGVCFMVLGVPVG